MAVDYEIVDNTLRINCLNWVVAPSIEDSAAAMGVVINRLLEAKNVLRVVLVERREIEYGFEETRMLQEIAEVYKGVLSSEDFTRMENFGCSQHAPKRFSEFRFLVSEVLRKDPIGAYVKIGLMIRSAEKESRASGDDCFKTYVERILLPIKSMLERTQMIKRVKDKIKLFKFGDRSLYRMLFHPLTRPTFMLTRFILTVPKEAILLDKYKVGTTDVEVYKVPGKVKYLYYILPEEFKLTQDMYDLIERARQYLAAHKPTEAELADPRRVRELFFNISRDLIKDLARTSKLYLSEEEVEKLANILVRYTVGFGVLELLLADDKVQDVYVNSPIGYSPIYIFHSDFEECETNLIPTKDEGESWATRFRLYSGRPLDEANPVLDTEIIVPGGRARVAAITRTLSPEGLAFAFRRHREKAWTFPLFIKVKMFNPLYAGLMSFIADGGRAVLIAGGRGAGKTSLLSALMLEIMRKFRILVQQDSVTGDCEILVSRNGKIERTTVGELVDNLLLKYGYKRESGREVLDKNPENIKVFTVDKNGKVRLALVSKFIRHKVSKNIFEIETRTGKKIRVTEDHSLFSLSKDGKLQPISAKDVKVGSYLVTPRILPVESEKVEKLNVLEFLEKLKDVYIVGPAIRSFILANKQLVKEIAKELGYTIYKTDKYPKSAFSYWLRNSILPCEVLKRMLAKGCKIDTTLLKFKVKGNSKPIQVEITLDQDFLSFIGLWLADGCYAKNGVIVSVVDEDTRGIVYKIGKRFSVKPRLCSDGFSLILGSTALKVLMRDVLELNGNAYTKRIPDWVFKLSKEQIAHVLKGLFSGDGYLTNYEAAITLASFGLIKDVQTALLFFGIISRVNRMNKKDKTYSCRISSQKFLKTFYEKIGFLQKERMEKLTKMCERVPSHDTTDVVPLPNEIKEEISKLLPSFNCNDYVKRGQNIGREKFAQVLESLGPNDCELEELKSLASSDIFWDEVRSIKCIGKVNDYVYDFSVPETENFVCENILAHNTLELPIDQLRQLGYNIESLKSRSVITRVETELSPDEALRTALRLGDSVLIVGEVRSVESTVLFEAMRIGALANLVAGTIHGESAYGVFDRVVHDLGLAPTSFKALDLLTICNMLRSPDGLHRFRRVTEVTEIRKKWKEDPLEEGGFVTLMEYSAKEDTLKPTDTLLNGESEVLNEIAKRVREWHGAWDLVWENILLRAKIKQTMVDYAQQLNRPEILEAEWVVPANEMFHSISEEVLREVGSVDSKLVYERWLKWFKDALR